MKWLLFISLLGLSAQGNEKQVVNSKELAAIAAGLKGPGDTERRTSFESLFKLLKDISGQERWDSLSELVKHLQPNAKVAVPLLIEVVQKDPENPKRELAADLLKAIGPEAKDAVPALLKVIENDKEPTSLRASAASALALIGSDGKPAIPILRKVLDTSPDDLLLVMAFQASLKALREHERADFVTLWKQLQGQDAAKGQAALRALFGPANKADPEMVNGALDAVTRLGPTAKASVPMFMASLNDKTEAPYVRHIAARALGGIGSEAEAAVPALIEALRDWSNSKDWIVRYGAAEGLKGIGPKAKGAISALVEAIESQDNAMVRAVAAQALGAMGSEAKEAVSALTRMFENRQDKAMPRYTIALALGAIGPEASESVPALIGALRKDEDTGVRFAATEALAGIGPKAESAIPILADALKDKEEWALLDRALKALEKIGSASIPRLLEVMRFYNGNRDGYFVRRGIVATLKRIAVVAQDSGNIEVASDLDDAVRTLKDSGFPEQDAEPLRLARDALVAIKQRKADEQRQRDEADQQQRDYQRKLLYVGAGSGALMVVLGGMLMGVLSGRLHRRVLVWLGYRLTLAVGRCEHIIQVYPVEGGFRVAYRSATPVGDGVTIDPDRILLPDPLLEMQKRIRGGTAMIEVDASGFRFPWTKVLGCKWSDGSNATVAGQVAQGLDSAPPPAARKRISFAGLGCCKADNGGRLLPSADLEVIAAEAAFMRGGAQIIHTGSGTTHQRATVQDLKNALQSADFVHVAAHATPQEIQLADGAFSSTDVPALGNLIGCRLLFLSACRAADFREIDQSLVYCLMRQGVNIIASREPVDDDVCYVFFEALYGAIFPRRHATGVDLAAAIRIASEACRKRFQKAEDTTAPFVRWKKCVDSFTLFGDPSLQLQAHMEKSE